MNTAFLLAAGLGTRLRPLTTYRPKPLLPVCGIPMLDYALAQLRAHGHERVLVNAHWLWEQVAAWAEDNGAELQVELPDILGTGGGLRAGLDRLADRFVVVNGDILSDVDLTALLAAVPDGGAAMALRPLPAGASITEVRAEHGRVVHIGGVVEGAGTPGTHFTGVHAMHKGAVLAHVPDDGLQCVVRTAYKALIPQGRVGSIVHAGSWVDVGTPAEYLRANLDVLAGRVAPPLDPWTRGRRSGESWIGAGAVVDGVVEDSVVGAGAHVPEGACLKNCVLWDGVRVPVGVHERTIFHDGGSLQV